MAQVRRIKLKNGLRVILVYLPESFTTTVMIAVEAGSEYETKETNGISHFLEHMCFKGTAKRPKTIDITAELDRLGAHYNAFTSQEFTNYYAKAISVHTPKILDILGDMYLHPLFPEEDIEKERGVIIEELNMYEDTPTRKVEELFFNLVYGDQPAGWDIGGKKEVIMKLKREDFIDYRNKFYIPNGTVVTISGRSANNASLNIVEKLFGHLPKKQKISKPPTLEKQTKPQELVFFKDVNQSHLVLGFRAFNIFDPRKYALYLAAEILGGSMSSWLFQKIREEMGIAYYIHANVDLYLDHGLFLISAGVTSGEIEKAIKEILVLCQKLARGEIGEEELKRAKEHWVGSFLMSLESSEGLASYYTGNEIIGLPMKSPQAVINKIKSVTVKDIKDAVKDVITNENLNLAVIGPFKKKSFAGILKVK